MSHNIPKKLQEQFIEWMSSNDPFNEDMSDGAWFAFLEDLAQQFMHINKIKGDNNEAVHFYIKKEQEKCNAFCGEYECKENQSNCKRKAQEK